MFKKKGYQGFLLLITGGFDCIHLPISVACRDHNEDSDRGLPNLIDDDLERLLGQKSQVRKKRYLWWCKLLKIMFNINDRVRGGSMLSGRSPSVFLGSIFGSFYLCCRLLYMVDDKCTLTTLIARCRIFRHPPCYTCVAAALSTDHICRVCSTENNFVLTTLRQCSVYHL